MALEIFLIIVTLSHLLIFQRKTTMRDEMQPADPSEEIKTDFRQKIPSVWRRLFCGIIDSAIMIFFLALFFMLYPPTADVLQANSSAKDWDGSFPGIDYSIDISMVLLIFCYYLLMHYFYGMTIGKMIGGCIVVMSDGTKVTFRASLKRTLFDCGGGMFLALVGDCMIHSEIRSFLEILVCVYNVLDCVWIVFSENHKAVHDLFSNTMVVSKN